MRRVGTGTTGGMEGRVGKGKVCPLGRASRRKRERRMGLLSEMPPRMAEIQDGTGNPTPGLSPGGTGLEKISVRLVEVARCLIGDDAEPEDVRWGISLAALAWNLSLLPQEARAGAMAELLGESEEKVGAAPDLLVLLERLMEQKRRLYPEDRRMVLSWQVRTSRREANVTVVSVLPDED